MKAGFGPESLDPAALEYIETEFPNPNQRAHFYQTINLLDGLSDEDKAKYREVADGVNIGYRDPKAATALTAGRMGFVPENPPPESHPILKRSHHPSGLEYPLEDELKLVNDEIAKILKIPRELLNAKNHDTVKLDQINAIFSKDAIINAFNTIFQKDQKNLKRYAKIEDRLKHTDTYLLTYCFIRIINTYYYLLILNPEHLSIAKSFEEAFVEIQRIISKAQLKQTILHDLVSGFIITLDNSIVNNQIAKAKRMNDQAQARSMILEAASLAQLGEQRARNMQSNMLKDRFYKDRCNYDIGFSAALIEGDLCLDHYSMAKTRIEELYQRIKSRKSIKFMLFEHIFISYLNKLAPLEITDAVLQQRLLWSLRIHPELDPKEEKSKQNKDELNANIKMLFGIFKERLSKILANFLELKYDPKSNTLEYTFSQTLPQSAVQTLKKEFDAKKPKFLFEIVNNKLILKNVTSIRLDKLSSILNESFVKYISQGEAAIQNALKNQQRLEQRNQKKAQASDKHKTEAAQQQTQTQLTNQSAVNTATQQLEKLTLTDKRTKAPKQVTKANEPPPPPAPVNAKPKRKAQPLAQPPVVQKQTEPSKKTGKALGLGNEAYHNLHFKKLENATGILVGFENEFAIGKGNPSKELILRFKDTICKEPKRVPPQNKNGFKWVESEGKVLLVGKIKKEKYRLRPIYSEVTKEGKTVFVYGTLTDTKSGKRSNRV